MAVEKNRPEKNPQGSGFFDDLSERVFKDYEPPKPDESGDEDPEDEVDNSRNQQAA